MSIQSATTYNSGEQAYYNGKEVTIVSSFYGNVRVKDECGNIIEVKKDDLSKYSIHSFTTKPQVSFTRKDIMSKIEELSNLGDKFKNIQLSFRKQKSDASRWIHNFLLDKGVPSKCYLSPEDRGVFDPKYDDKWNFSSLEVEYGNKALSYYNQATRVAFWLRDLP